MKLFQSQEVPGRAVSAVPNNFKLLKINDNRIRTSCKIKSNTS